MKNKILLLSLSFLILGSLTVFAQKESTQKEVQKDRSHQVDTRIDNMAYWKGLAAEGVIPVEPTHFYPPAIETGSKIKAFGVITEDSPDVPVTDATNVTESENSIFVSHANAEYVLNSNNSTSWSGSSVGTLYGANYFYSDDLGLTWGGSAQGAGGNNSGDPATAINLDGSRMYVNYIAANYGMGVANSTDGGQSWQHVQAAPNPGSLADKNHMWIDNSPSSPYEGNLYVAYTDFGGIYDSDIALTYSDDEGMSWSSVTNVSQGIAGGGHCQGVHISTGPNGEVYVIFAIYYSWPSDESAIGMVKSLDGGASWSAPVTIIDNIRGIRTSETSKNHRVNSFPVSATDIVGGNIYVTWANIGVPGINTGNDIDVYIIKSEDGGDSWSDPIRVNQDESGQGHEHYFPWITCDPVTGVVSAVFYDDRNVGGSQCEVYCANSFDGGETWEDFKVSDVSFTPAPISGLAGGYMGDYLSISAYGSYVYPCWTDNRGSTYMTYVSPYITNNRPRPTDLLLDLTFSTGTVDLSWDFEETEDFLYFNVYRGDELLGTTSDQFYSNDLPDYGVFSFKVTAMHDDGESAPAVGSIQWGDPQIEVNPDEVNASLSPGESTVEVVTITNIGQLDLTYDITPYIDTDKSRDYCTTGYSNQSDDWISNVTINTIDNDSGSDPGGYADFTEISTLLEPGMTYDISVEVTVDGSWVQYVMVWFDWNMNDDFSDAGESIDLGATPGSSGSHVLTGSVTVPADAILGTTRMRVAEKWNEAPGPCDQATYGEAEDYSIEVQGWLFIDPLEGMLTPSESQEIQITLDAADLEEGTYTASLNIASDDPDDPMVSVPITLVVSDNLPLVNATADPSLICEGEGSQLSATGEGGSGTYTYSWTSDPEGFTSDEQNPYFENIMEETTFTVELNDGNYSVYASTTVNVNPLPDVLFELAMDTVCIFYNPVELTEGTPAGGLYEGTGVYEESGLYFFSPEEAGLGTHYITYTYEDANGCVNTAEDMIQVELCEGIANYSADISMEIFPNPNNGVFTMSIQKTDQSISSISIYNTFGTEVYYEEAIDAKEYLSKELDLSTQPEGIYFINILGDEINIIKKVVVRK